MFPSNKAGGGNNMSVASQEKEGVSTTVIARGTTIEGKFACAENVRLDGNILGEVHVQKRFVMGDTSFVKGDIRAHNAAIKGKVAGNLIIEEALHLMDSAEIEGDITAKTIVVEEGARFNGKCLIGINAGAGKFPGSAN
jgi:cytoskeletal protein CcmA (bactofilin family)